MKKRSFRSSFVSVILVITIAIFTVNLVVYGINIKEIRQAEVLKMKTAGERIDDMITIYISNSSYFYMANLDSVTKKAAQMAKQKGSKIFMDADSYTDELLDAISWIDIFIGSEFVYEKMLEAGKSVKENCEYLYNKGPEIVIFTFGEKGCAGISKEGFFEIPAFDVDVKDTVGAGDVFHGAFLAAIVKGLSPKDAARFASGVAAIKCTRIGGRAGIPNWEVTDNFLETGEIDYREIDERVKKYGRGIEYV